MTDGKNPTPFRAGDLVKLKSGGPVMTVGALRPKECECIWMLESRVQSAIFRYDCIVSCNEKGVTGGNRIYLCPDCGTSLHGLYCPNDDCPRNDVEDIVSEQGGK